MLHEQISKNKRKTVLIVTIFLILYISVSVAFGYLLLEDVTASLILGSGVGVMYAIIVVATTKRRVLNMTNGKPIEKEDNMLLYNVVEEMSIAAGLPMPDIYIVPTKVPNAFASGFSPEDSIVGVTEGLLELLNREELEGVIAHEMAHIQNYDVRLNTIIVSLVSSILFMTRISMRRSRRRSSSSNNDNNSGAIMLIASVIILLVAPIVANLVQLSVSRNREYLADATAADLTRNPTGLKNALMKINGYVEGSLEEKGLVENKEEDELDEEEGFEEWMATMYIINPLKAFTKSENKDSIWSTHPNTYNRIERLEEMM